MYDLKPCPFCGGEAELVEHPLDRLITTFGVVCSRCGCMTQPNYTFKIGAIGAWNRRLNENNQKN